MKNVTLIFALAIYLCQISYSQEFDSYESFLSEFTSLTSNSNEVYYVTETFMLKYGSNIVINEGKITFFNDIGDGKKVAYFEGSGDFLYTPTDPLEMTAFELMSGDKQMIKAFDRALIIFEDDTYDLLSQTKITDSEITEKANNFYKDNLTYFKEVTENKDIRVIKESISKAILEDGNSNFFSILFYSSDDKDPFYYEYCPYYRENITFAETNTHNVWGGYLMDLSSTAFDNPYSIPDYYTDEIVITDIKTNNTFDKDLFYTCEAEVTFKAVRPDFQWISLSLDSELKLDSVKNLNGEHIKYYKAEQSGTVWILMPEIAVADKEYKYKFYYNGKIANRARDFMTGLDEMVYIKRFLTWYPVYDDEVKFFVNFDNTFNYPDIFVFSTIGEKIEDEKYKEGKEKYIKTRWKTKRPAKHALFNIVPFMEKEVKGEPNFYIHHYHSSMWKEVKTDLVRSYEFYSEFFGPLDHKEIYLTEIPWGHGQAAPGFVHLSQLAFITTQDDGSMESFVAHEVAHQWWGLEVGWDSYHDMWVSEGFAEYSSMMYLQYVFGNNDKMFDKLNDYKERLVKAARLKSTKNTKPAGIIQIGARNGRLADGNGYMLTVYEKGAWVLHMIRNMLIDFYSNDETLFNTILKDFFATYRGKNAKIEDFEKIMEKHVGQDVSWFFNQWVRSWEIPTYNYAFNQSNTEDGKYKVTMRITQEHVPETFLMSVPIKVVYENGKMDILRVTMTGKEAEFDLPLFAFEVKDIEFNAFNSVLCEVNQKKNFDF